MVSVRNGMSSERVLSTPSASAIVESFFIEFNLKQNRVVKILTRYRMTIGLKFLTLTMILLEKLAWALELTKLNTRYLKSS